MGLMAVINIVALFGLATVVFEVAKDYRDQRKRKLNPVFKIENLKANFSNIEAWGNNPYSRNEDTAVKKKNKPTVDSEEENVSENKDETLNDDKKDQ